MVLGHTVSASLLADQVYDRLRARIARGDWAPGRRLRIREIAAEVGTSEMPVREAFRRLEQAGLILVEPYKGAQVRVLSIDELEQIYDVRIMLEPLAAALGTARAGTGTAAAMRTHWQLLQDAAEHGDVARAVAEDERLLDALYMAGGNLVLAATIRDLWDTSRLYKCLWVRNAVAQGMSAWNHLPDLIAAVDTADAPAAQRILEDTYRNSRATVRGLLSGNGDGAP